MASEMLGYVCDELVTNFAFSLRSMHQHVSFEFIWTDSYVIAAGAFEWKNFLVISLKVRYQTVFQDIGSGA